MGTETVIPRFGRCSFDRVSVKLNNPLMGTETYRWFRNIPQHCRSTVKLNNPLMGTEI